jgi:DNA repair protein RadA
MVGEALGKELRDENADPIRLIIIDSITSAFRMDFSGRGELGERQQLIKKHIKHISRIAEIYNVVVLLTNQVMVSPSVMFGDPVKPIGGTTLGHTSTHRVYLRKSGKDKIVAKLVDSPNNAQNEAVLALTRAGVVDGE